MRESQWKENIKQRASSFIPAPVSLVLLRLQFKKQKEEKATAGKRNHRTVQISSFKKVDEYSTRAWILKLEEPRNEFQGIFSANL